MQTVVQLRELCLQVGKVCFCDVGVIAKYVNGLESIVEEVVNELLCVSHAVLGFRSVLRRPFVRSLVSAVRSQYQTVHPEL